MQTGENMQTRLYKDADDGRYRDEDHCAVLCSVWARKLGITQPGVVFTVHETPTAGSWTAQYLGDAFCTEFEETGECAHEPECDDTCYDDALLVEAPEGESSYLVPELHEGLRGRVNHGRPVYFTWEVT